MHNKSTKHDCVEGEGCADPDVEIAVEKIDAHPYFVGKKDVIHDIALLRLEKEVTYTGNFDFSIM